MNRALPTLAILVIAITCSISSNAETELLDDPVDLATCTAGDGSHLSDATCARMRRMPPERSYLESCTYADGAKMDETMCAHLRDAWNDRVREQLQKRAEHQGAQSALAKMVARDDERKRVEKENEDKALAEVTARMKAQNARIRQDAIRDRTPMTSAEIDATLTQKQTCIESSDARIQEQQEIGKAAGVVDKSVLYKFGSQKVKCQHQIDALRACKVGGTTCLPRDFY